MKKIFWRVFVAFGVVLLVFTIPHEYCRGVQTAVRGFGRWRCHSDKSGSKRP